MYYEAGMNELPQTITRMVFWDLCNDSIYGPSAMICCYSCDDASSLGTKP